MFWFLGGALFLELFSVSVFFLFFIFYSAAENIRDNSGICSWAVNVRRFILSFVLF